ncbi:MAG: hypothetical protein EXQ89_07340, partial [Rhodospirillaceae bacterium]|nr:hypothetical protein [Rhodospirillaceae bacterium]
LVGATLVGATLVGATLVGATLVGATLVGATLVGATLVGATLVGATFAAAVLAAVFAAAGAAVCVGVFVATLVAMPVVLTRDSSWADGRRAPACGFAAAPFWAAGFFFLWDGSVRVGRVFAGFADLLDSRAFVLSAPDFVQVA